MAKYFPKLTQTEVRIDTAGGDSIMVPMLPVKYIGDFERIRGGLVKAQTPEDCERLRKKMVELAKKVMPKETWSNLLRFDLVKLAELVAYLLFGDDDDEAKKKPVNQPKNGK